jgi:YgiT-type zinc finger domain-containing protein
MKCTVVGCPGEYEARYITHTVRHNGDVMVIDDVPAEVCTVCGDTLMKPVTVRHIEALLRSARSPVRMAPVYTYA